MHLETAKTTFINGEDAKKVIKSKNFSFFEANKTPRSPKRYNFPNLS